MTSVLKIFGPPGTGKTETLMRKIEEALGQGTNPSRIGFVSFSRKAVAEGKDRAQARFGLSDKQMIFWRTLHSMAFSALGLRKEDVMTTADYKEVGMLVGEVMTVNIQPEDGVPIPVDMKRGSRYLAIIDRARYRMVTLEEEWKEHDTYDLHLSKAQQIQEQLAEYKSAHSKIDFVDMIEQYVHVVDPPTLDLFIVDEAQDLTPLQFEMVKKISDYAARTITAGDDDQCIHAWAGARSKDFIEFGEDQLILTQSYRLPEAVFNVANHIVHRISDRVPKDYAPMDEKGSVDYHYNLDTVPLECGSWTIMARTNMIVSKFADALKDLGYYFSVKGYPPIQESKVFGILTWRHLSNGGAISLSDTKRLYDLLPKQGDKAVLSRGAKKLLEAADPEQPITKDDMINSYGMRPAMRFDERDEFDVLGLGDDIRSYVTAVEQSGEDITKPPRIKLSTFHAMKGGEDDNCAVYLGSTYACVNKSPEDDEHRAFYVGVTRARKTLHIIDPGYNEKYRYEL
jgi:DNA helicase-2/ATP-dependent DNA helicase PcrA